MGFHSSVTLSCNTGKPTAAPYKNMTIRPIAFARAAH